MASSTLAATVTFLSFRPLFKNLTLFPITKTPLTKLPTQFTCSLSTTTTNEFNISFAPPKTKPTPEAHTEAQSKAQVVPLVIPWIVRGEDGQFKIQNEPPAKLLHEMANAKTGKANSVAKKGKKVGGGGKGVRVEVAGGKKVVLSSEPKYSKAARRFYNENFREKPQRLSKVLAAAGVASRRSSEELIFEGKVTVNGTVCNTPQTRVDLAKDMIYVNGSRISKKLPPKVYLALNKPKGYICSSGEKESKSVISLFEEYLKSWNRRFPGIPKPRLFTVGRLDVATTGLIIVTNDGDFAQKLSHPSSQLSKEYIAAIAGVVSKRHLVAVAAGTVIEGVQCTPDSVELLPQQPDMPRPRLRIVVHEGRNHEVREIVKNAGLELHSLKRVRIGGYRLPSDLGLGNHVELRLAELKALGGKIN